MPGTRAQLAAGFDLAALANVSAKAGEILVIDVANVVCAVLADLAAAAKATTSAATATAGASGSTASSTLGAAEAAWAGICVVRSL